MLFFKIFNILLDHIYHYFIIHQIITQNLNLFNSFTYLLILTYLIIY